MSLKNHDILGITRRINRFIEEAQKSASAGISGVSAADLARLNSYLAALVAYKEWVVSQPELDLPETHPVEYAVPAGPEVASTENESIFDVVNLLVKLRDELVLSQSSQLASNLIAHDSTRFDEIVTKVQSFVTDYIEPQTPLDLPESSPKST